MKYTIENEFETFDFHESYVKDIEPGNGYFHIWLDNVKILPGNSCNRDIRTMRTNNMLLTIHDMEMVSMIHEGVKIYDADGRLAGERSDVMIEKEKCAELWPLFFEGCVYSISKENWACFKNALIQLTLSDCQTHQTSSIYAVFRLLPEQRFVNLI